MINLMRKILSSLVVSFFFLAYSFSPALAATINICPENQEGGAGFSKLCQLDFGNFSSLISKLITLVLIVAVVIAVFFLIWGGIKWITSGGDKQGVESARGHIIAAIIGLVIALLAFFIINVIGGLFGISLTELKLPSLNP